MITPRQKAPVLEPSVWETLRSSHAVHMSDTSPAYDESLGEVASESNPRNRQHRKGWHRCLVVLETPPREYALGPKADDHARRRRSCRDGEGGNCRKRRVTDCPRSRRCSLEGMPPKRRRPVFWGLLWVMDLNFIRRIVLDALGIAEPWSSWCWGLSWLPYSSP